MKVELNKEMGRLTPREEGCPGIYKCECRCGRTFEVPGDRLQEGGMNCGCARKDKPKIIEDEFGTYADEIQTRALWRFICRACETDNIEIQSSWTKSYKEFRADMGLRPEGAIIKRRDRLEGYTKENCYWGDK